MIGQVLQKIGEPATPQNWLDLEKRTFCLEKTIRKRQQEEEEEETGNIEIGRKPVLLSAIVFVLCSLHAIRASPNLHKCKR